MRIGYLVNLYPGMSHPSIRREIAALEALGVEVQRFSIRRAADTLVDPDDRAELERTRVVLARGLWRVVVAMSWTALRSPRRFATALALAVRAGWRSERGLFRYFGSLAEACLMRQWLAASGCTHVHAHFESSTAVAMLQAALGGCPYSFTVHGPEEFEDIGRRGLTCKLAGARFVVAISEYCKARLLSVPERGLESKLHVLRCGVDARFLEPPTPVPDVRRLVVLGRLVPRKGHVLALAAAKQLAAEGVDFELSIVGDGELSAALSRAIVREGLERYVRLEGWSGGSEVRSSLVNARALVLPSFAEGLPVSIMEAFALGRPVVATCVEAVPELVDETCGWVVPPGSVTALAAALREVLATPVAELTDLGLAGRRRVEQLHDVRATATALKALFAPDPEHGVRELGPAGRSGAGSPHATSL